MILSLDLGTSTFKAAVFAYDGACVSQASVPLNITGGGLRYEVDPAVWLRAMETALPRLRGVAGVEALAVSGNGPTLVPVTGTPGLDSTGLSVPGGAARLWLDRRAQGESRRVSALAGAYVDPSFFLPKALWIKNQEPRLYGETRFFLSAPEYLL
ncbi:MAG: hypothetical protein LBQ61_03830, partial [Spirochaetales bacterium]|nr:hypothetical protein [Spirochaetales bacterium]